MPRSERAGSVLLCRCVNGLRRQPTIVVHADPAVFRSHRNPLLRVAGAPVSAGRAMVKAGLGVLWANLLLYRETLAPGDVTQVACQLKDQLAGSELIGMMVDGDSATVSLLPRVHNKLSSARLRESNSPVLRGSFVVMASGNNPYRSPLDESTPVGFSEPPQAQRFGRVFKYSYVASLPVAVGVPTVLMAVFWDRPPGMVEVMFVFLSTVPSVFTCLIFSSCFCWLVRSRGDRKRWPAILFGVCSGLSFNAMTAITAIEYFFSW